MARRDRATSYRFLHALYQEVLYDAHAGRAAGRTSSVASRSARRPPTASGRRRLRRNSRYHYSRSDNVARATRYLHLAAEQTANRAAYGQAASTLDTALKLVNSLPDGGERMRTELALRTTENVVTAVLYGLASEERQRAIERICELAEQLGERATQLRGLINLAALYFPRGEPLRALELARQCLELAEGIEEPEMLAATHLVAGFAAHGCGRLAEATTHYRAAMGHAEHANQGNSVLPMEPWSVAAVQAGFALQLLGHSVEAVKLVEAGLSRAREAQHRFTLGGVLTVEGWFHQYRREPEVVRALVTPRLHYPKQMAFRSGCARGHYNRGWALAELGQVADGVAEMERKGIAGMRKVGGVPREQFSLVMLAQGYARLNQVDEALALVENALGRVAATGERIDEAEMLRLKGEILLMRDGSAIEEAESCFRAAIELARVQEARWWELRATMSLARLLRGTVVATTRVRCSRRFTTGLPRASTPPI